MARLVRRVCWGLLALGTTSAAAFSVYSIHQFIFRSGYFTISDIRISGASPALEDAARSFIQAQITSLDEQNLFVFDDRYTAHKLLELPRTRTVRVSKVFPQSLRIEFTEREPLMVANLGRLYLIDEDGVLIDAISPAQIKQAGLPVLTGVTKNDYNPGQRIKQPSTKQVLETVKLLHGGNPDLYRRIIEWNVDGPRGITAILDTHTEVRFGENVTSDLLAKLDGALSDEQLRPQIEHATYVDLRMERQIVLR